MLRLKNITKEYATGDLTVNALKGSNLNFRKNEFVSILGPSGCGKTTTLNIVGGLDRYTDGDLFIKGVSTKDFKAKDWDAYRNYAVGFVFQSYNLIPHLSVVGNVELALTLSGISKKERRARAVEALVKVGLKEQVNKKPNQLSGGQLQRVAIARAIVNNPQIVLADEPTGALDSVTSVQILDLLQEIAKDRLVIMVTHNEELAKKYSTRIVKLLDGEIISDSNPLSEQDEIREVEQTLVQEKHQKQQEKLQLCEEITNKKTKGKATYSSLDNNEKKKIDKKVENIEKEKKKKTSMSFFTALSLSFRNLFTKKARTILTSIAGSIGIIGVALVLCISNGFNGYIGRMQTDMLSGFPISVDAVVPDMNAFMSGGANRLDKFPNKDSILSYESQKISTLNVLSKDFTTYLSKMDKKLVNDVVYEKGVAMNVIGRKNSSSAYGYVGTSAVSADMSSMDFTSQTRGLLGVQAKFGTQLMSNHEFIKTQYDVIAGHYPNATDIENDNVAEVALVVDSYNKLGKSVLDMLQIENTGGQDIPFNDILAKEYSLILNDDFYSYNSASGLFTANGMDDSLYNKGVKIKIAGVLRVKETAGSSSLNTGIVYRQELTEFVEKNAKESLFAQKQSENRERSLLVNKSFRELVPMYSSQVDASDAKIEKFLMNSAMQIAGADDTAFMIKVYPKDFDSKIKIKEYIMEYNEGKEKADTINYTDAAEMVTTTMVNLIDTISIVLIAFASISLVVSSIMIGIITYVSVVERTKEIGVLRSIGARKKDISRVFNAETIIVGFTAGLIGVLIAFLLTFPINLIMASFVGPMIGSIAVFNPLHALLLVVISVVLTLVAGLIPSRIASKRDPVIALRA